MVARRPTDDTLLISLPRHTPQSIEQAEKIFNIQNEAINFLVPHVRKIVEAFYREEMGDPAERAVKEHVEWQEQARSLGDLQKELDEMDNEEEKNLVSQLIGEMKKMGDITKEEMMRINQEVDEELIEENSRMAASYIWQSIVYTGTRIFKRLGPQSIDVQAFLAGLDLATCLVGKIPEKYYPEIKMTLALYMPQIFKKSFIGRVEEKYMEMFLQESSEQIVLREVSYEMFQIWVNS